MKSDKIYEGKILNLRVDTVEMPDKKYSKREIVEHSGGVAVVALTDEGKVVMVRQFRKAIEDYLLELPAGKLEYGEDPLECAKRELKEETGYEAEDLELLCELYSSPGFSTEKIYIYFSKELKKGNQELDEDEYLEVEEIEFDKLMEMILKVELKDSKTVAGILLAEKKLK